MFVWEEFDVSLRCRTEQTEVCGRYVDAILMIKSCVFILEIYPVVYWCRTYMCYTFSAQEWMLYEKKKLILMFMFYSETCDLWTLSCDRSCDMKEANHVAAISLAEAQRLLPYWQSDIIVVGKTSLSNQWTLKKLLIRKRIFDRLFYKNCRMCPKWIIKKEKNPKEVFVVFSQFTSS